MPPRLSGLPATQAGYINDKSTALERHAGKPCSSTTTPSAHTAGTLFSLAWHTFSSGQASANSLPTALQSRIQRSHPGSALSASRRQGALPRLDADTSRRPGHPHASCLRKPARRDHQWPTPPLSHGEPDAVLPPRKGAGSTPKGGREPTRGSYASRCREHPDRWGDLRGLRLTTARRGSVRRRRSTGSGDGRIGHR